MHPKLGHRFPLLFSLLLQSLCWGTCAIVCSEILHHAHSRQPCVFQNPHENTMPHCGANPDDQVCLFIPIPISLIYSGIFVYTGHENPYAIQTKYLQAVPLPPGSGKPSSPSRLQKSILEKLHSEVQGWFILKPRLHARGQHRLGESFSFQQLSAPSPYPHFLVHTCDQACFMNEKDRGMNPVPK